MNLKKLLLAVPVVLLFAAPAWAGTFGVYGAYYDAGGDVEDSTYGAGVRLGFEFVPILELDIHATYFDKFEQDLGPAGTAEFTVMPLDAGIKFNILPKKKFNPYIGAGATYWFLDTNFGSVDDEVGYYALAGVDFGGEKGKFFVEAMYRTLDSTFSDSGGDFDASADGYTLNAGFLWRW
jgi:hypothetical protein